MTPSTKTIKLHDPVLFHETMIREITLREPGWQIVSGLGYPSEIMQAGGALTIATFPQTIAAYATGCVQPQDHAAALNMLSLRDTLAIHQAVVDFFSEARAAPSPKPGSDLPALSSRTTAAA